MHVETVSLTIRVPSALADAGTAELARVLLVLDAVRSQRMTWRAAARALEVAPDRLLDLAREHGTPVVHYEATQLAEDIATLEKLDALGVRGR